jgi:DNA polymerase-3 subunit delta'
VSWQRVQGHEAQAAAFARAVRRGRLAHAYLFIGPSGIGKRLFAVELAKALLCEAAAADRPPDALEACDQCPACKQIDAGTHPDFRIAVRPPEASEFPIELMRDVCHGFALKSARGRGKIVVIDDADDLNEESANCFLKTLEEPPPRSMLILIGTGTERQRATITSRCQVVRFRPPPPSLVDGLLQEQGVEDPARREQLLRLGGGSPGQALALAEPALWDFRRTLLQGLTGRRYDGVGLAKTWIEFVQDAGKEAVHHRRRARQVLRLLIDFLNAALGRGVDAVVRGGEGEDKALLDALAARLSPDQILTLLDRCLEADFQIERNVQTGLVLEALLDDFAASLGPTRP